MISTFIIGSSRAGSAALQASLKAIDAAIWKATSSLSRALKAPATTSTFTSMMG